MNFVISILVSLVAVSILASIPLIGVGALDLRILFGIIIPYAALATFFIGIFQRLMMMWLPRTAKIFLTTIPLIN